VTTTTYGRRCLSSIAVLFNDELVRGLLTDCRITRIAAAARLRPSAYLCRALAKEEDWPILALDYGFLGLECSGNSPRGANADMAGAQRTQMSDKTCLCSSRLSGCCDLAQAQVIASARRIWTAPAKIHRCA
jgi:hypothetical protein